MAVPELWTLGIISRHATFRHREEDGGETEEAKAVFRPLALDASFEFCFQHLLRSLLFFDFVALFSVGFGERCKFCGCCSVCLSAYMEWSVDYA